jgi:predicted O-methyltransferase YrrM
MDYQNQAELEKLIYLVKELNAKSILEIGSMYGDSLRPWIRIADVIASIDWDLQKDDSRYSKQMEERHESNLLASELGKKFKIFPMDSHSYDTLEQVKNFFGGPIDFLFIDGDHSYTGVKLDFKMYSELVRPGGIIAFHDIVPNPNFGDIQVPVFWNELKSVRFPHREIKYDTNQFGIGVICR